MSIRKIKISKNKLVKNLMVTCLILLFILQIFSLKKTYQYQKQILKVQVEVLFKDLMTTIHEQYLKETSQYSQVLKKGSGSSMYFRQINPNEKIDKVKLDSLLPFSVIIKDTLESTYRKKLAGNDIRLPFLWHIDKTGPNIEATQLQTTSYILPPSFDHYWVVFPEHKTWVLYKIIPEIIFAFILWLIISSVFMYTWKIWQKQKQLTLLKDEFMSNMAHELKTPISTVRVALEALQKYQLIQDQKLTEEYLNISQQQIQRLSGLVENMIEISIFEHKEITLNFENIDFNKLIKRVTHSLEPVLQYSNATIKIISIGDEFYIDGDQTHLTNVIYNLLDNALKYSLKKPQIIISLKKTEQNIMLSIKDNGIGISKEYQNKIFEKFFRVPLNDRHNVKGHGLGLTYVAEVIRLHGGKIQVNSSLNKGTTILITI